MAERKVDREIRLSQTVAPFGVGAIYDYLGESLIAEDVGRWMGDGRSLRAERLRRALGVSDLRSAPTKGNGREQAARVPFARFPQWLFCPSCRQMKRYSWSDEVMGRAPECGCSARARLVPMRFVVACESGHLADVDWRYWAHHGATSPEQKQCQTSDRLRFLSQRGKGSGLRSLRVRCDACNAERTLHGITAPDALKRLGVRCRGTQPWQPSSAGVECESTPQVLQRGASNLYFARVVSAIEVPPESDFDPDGDLAERILNHPSAGALKTGNYSAEMTTTLERSVASDCRCLAEDVRRIIRRARGEADLVSLVDSDADFDSLRDEEWAAFTHLQPDQDARSSFVVESVPLFGETPNDAMASARSSLAAAVDSVVIARKLREVRALYGFTRYRPDGTLVTPDLGKLPAEQRFLPAIEVFGEGVFIALSEARLREWESRPGVQDRVEVLQQRLEESKMGWRLPAKLTPRFVMIHTLAHLLIRELAFTCGYSAASLRERIYATSSSSSGSHAGLLIYTAAGDSEGTLGGLARQGEPPRLAVSILRALRAARWCSSDPICGESAGQGNGGLNLAACHACTLLAETSCEYGNVALDRSLLVGGPSFKSGFLVEVLERSLRVS